MRVLLLLAILASPTISYAEGSVYEIGRGFAALWTPNTEPDISHYNLYLREETEEFGDPVKVNHSQQLVDGSTVYQRSSIFNITVPGQYYLTVSAVDASGNESDQHNEVPLMMVVNAPPVEPSFIVYDPIPFEPFTILSGDEHVQTVILPKPLNFNVDATIIMDVNDPDFSDEGNLYINEKGPIKLFGPDASEEHDSTKVDSVEISIVTPSLYWKHGENKLRFTHVRTHGYTILAIKKVIFD